MPVTRNRNGDQVGLLDGKTAIVMCAVLERTVVVDPKQLRWQPTEMSAKQAYLRHRRARPKSA